MNVTVYHSGNLDIIFSYSDKNKTKNTSIVVIAHRVNLRSIIPFSRVMEKEYNRKISLGILGSTFVAYKKIFLCVFAICFISLWVGKDMLTLSHDPQIVIILAANEGGGVLRWKSEQEWAIERISIKNKQAYARRHGYGLTIKDLTTAKRYSHEYREGWQKVDILKQTMREYPNTEWFWWLDASTLIMEPDISLENHIFNRLDSLVNRTLKDFNPLKLPTDIPYVDYSKELSLLVTQDCGGFNLGSFLIRNTEWTKLLLDIWWDPVGYEQNHMIWEHREQDALEALYANEPWIRERVGFLPLRYINSFPRGACSEYNNDPRYFYNKKDRDFLVNMAGCNFGRDCWGEIQQYINIMAKLNHKWYSRLFS